MNLEAARIAALDMAAHIDAKTKAKLLKRVRKQGMTDPNEAIVLIEAWKRAARQTKRLHVEHGRHKGH